MTSNVLGIAKKLGNLTEKTVLGSLRRSLYTKTDINRGGGTSATTRGILFSKINQLRDPSISVVPVLEQWAKKVSKINVHELRNILRTLRTNKRYIQALQVTLLICSIIS